MRLVVLLLFLVALVFPATVTAQQDCGPSARPSGKSACVENGKSGTQGKSPSDPDKTINGGPDKNGQSGGVNKQDQDRNNGCGNDQDFEDDNKGNCGPKPKPTPVPTVQPTVPPTAVPTTAPTNTAVPTNTPVPTVAPTNTPVPTAVPTNTPVGDNPGNERSNTPTPVPNVSVSNAVQDTGVANRTTNVVSVPSTTPQPSPTAEVKGVAVPLEELPAQTQVPAVEAQDETVEVVPAVGPLTPTPVPTAAVQPVVQPTAVVQPARAPVAPRATVLPVTGEAPLGLLLLVASAILTGLGIRRLS